VRFAYYAAAPAWRRSRPGIRSTFVSLIERGQRGMRWHTLLAMLRA